MTRRIACLSACLTVCLTALGLLVAPLAAGAAAIPAPAELLAMWNGRDGATLRTELRRYAADGDRAGASASERLDAGEAAYWLGVQHARAGRADSALAEWRRATRLRGDFDEGFALIDFLCRRGTPDDLREAHAHAVTFAEQSMSILQRQQEAHARLAWTLYLMGHADSAATEIRDNCEELYRRPPWTRRFATIQLAAGDTAGAWRWLVLLSARTRRRDAELEGLLVRAQHTLHYNDERLQLSVGLSLERIGAQEEAFAHSLGGRIESMRARDGFPLQILTFPAAREGVRRAPCLLVLAPADTVVATDSLVAALTRAGHPVALFAPRGTLGSLGPGALGPEDWLGEDARFETVTTADAGLVLDALGKRGDFAGTGWIVGGMGERALAALAIARTRRNVAALLLVAPRVPVVEIAEYRARLRAMKTRTFVQVAPEEPSALEFGDLLARDTPAGQVRVADSGLAGRGAAIFRGDPRVPARFVAWLEERPKAR